MNWIALLGTSASVVSAFVAWRNAKGAANAKIEAKASADRAEEFLNLAGRRDEREAIARNEQVHDREAKMREEARDAAHPGLFGKP